MHAPLTQDESVSVKWFALIVKSGLERKACIWLRRRQFSPYWPRYRGLVKLNRHRKALRWRSVIPGYLFLPLGTSETINVELLKRGPGIRNVMRSGNGDVANIALRDVERVKSAESALNASAIAAAAGIPFKVGQKIWVKDLELDGIVKTIDSRRNIGVDIGMFGTVVRMVTSAEKLELH